MTAVIIAPRVENLDSDVESVISGGSFRIRPAKAYVAGGQWVQPIWSAPKLLTGSAVTVQLDPVSVPYELELTYQDGSGAPFSPPNEFRIVTASGTAVAWETLTQVPGPGGGAVLTDVVDARLDALEAAIGTVTGGASTLAGISDMSAFMRTVNDDTSAAAARTTLGAADATATVNLTGDQTVGGIKTFSSAPVVPDASIAQAKVTGLVADLAAKATDTAVVHNTGAETVAGVKTFSSAPVVPNASFAIAATSGLQAALDAIVITGGIVASAHPTDPDVTRLTWA